MLQQLPTVLVVEDSPTQAEQIAYVLSKYDIQVIIANDGAQGLRMVAAQQPDLIVLDVNMPRMNGYRMCQRIRRDPNTTHIPIILLSAESSPDAVQRGRDAGANGYIAKDVDAIPCLLNALSTYGLLPESYAQV